LEQLQPCQHPISASLSESRFPAFDAPNGLPYRATCFCGCRLQCKRFCPLWVSDRVRSSVRPVVAAFQKPLAGMVICASGPNLYSLSCFAQSRSTGFSDPDRFDHFAHLEQLASRKVDGIKAQARIIGEDQTIRNRRLRLPIAQHRHGFLIESYMAGPLRFCGCAVDRQYAPVKIDIRPIEIEQITASATSVDRQQDQRLQMVGEGQSPHRRQQHITPLTTPVIGGITFCSPPFLACVKRLPQPRLLLFGKVAEFDAIIDPRLFDLCQWIDCQQIPIDRMAEASLDRGNVAADRLKAQTPPDFSITPAF
jgi:hypothetical protein